MNKIFSLIITLSVLFTGCNSEDFVVHELGGDLIESSTVVNCVDSFTIKSSTVIMDSIQTSSVGSVSVGRYVDDYLGAMKATVYSKVDLGSAFSLEDTDEAELDSIVLVVYSSGVFWGDTTQTQTISVHKVTEKIEITSKKPAYYNKDSLSIDSKAIGVKTFRARPQRKDDLNSTNYHDFRIRLDDKFGQQILDSALVNNSFTSSAARWEKELKGIALVPGEDDNASVLNFPTDSMNIRLYYRTIGGSAGGAVERHRDFALSSSLSFTNYQADRTNTEELGSSLGGLTEREVGVLSERTNNLSFIQAGTGIYTKLEIPYLEMLNQEGDAASLISAVLQVYPLSATFEQDLFPLYGLEFEIYETDRLNRLVSTIVNSSGSQVTSIYYVNYENPEDTPLSFDLTNYVSGVLADGMLENEGLLIKFSDETNNEFVSRMVIDNDPDSSVKIKLKVTYAVQK